MISGVFRRPLRVSLPLSYCRHFSTTPAKMIMKPSPFRLAILDCDTPLPQAREKYETYSGMFEALLKAGAKAKGYSKLDSILRIQRVNIEDDPEGYPDQDDIDGILLTGSRHDSFSDAPWIEKLVDYTARALQENRLKVIGVCFGHQVIARAMGIEVGRNPEGWEAAVNEVQLSPEGKKLFGKDNIHLHQMHRDIVTHLPKGATALGSSPVCRVQAMYVPRQLFTTQGHPEFNEPIMREILDTRLATGIFDEETYNLYINNVALPHDGLLVGKSFVHFLIDE